MEKDYFNGKTDADKKIIHLYILNKCTHHCKFCCNNEYSTNSIPVATVEEMQNANTICLTGGEPFLLDEICDFAKQIKQQYNNIKQIYVYTCGDSLYHWLERNKTLHDIDGVNISPKNRYDADCVNKILETPDYVNQLLGMWSNRIYLFPNVRTLINRDLQCYDSINIMDREWQEDFEPDSGIFRRLPILFN